MEESRSVPQIVQSSLEAPYRVIVLVETLRRLHAHRIALRHGRVRESNTSVTEQDAEVFRQSHRQQHSRDLKPRSGTVEVCIQRICELSHHETHSHLLWSLSPVTPACRPDFASHLSSQNCLTHGRTFHQVEFTIRTFYHLSSCSSSNVSSSL